VDSPVFADGKGEGNDEDAMDWFMFERRLNSRSSRLRHNDAYFLLYTILDTIVRGVRAQPLFHPSLTHNTHS